ncbi:MAG: hypothetical protein PHR60_00285 [Eubacteriales bacterium]|nr:hypothetical protein [Eubacteriales bacterium]MDD3874667.1 hypothetical protein [Methanosarcina sp.]MDD4582614.1 hypothetical protein [Eubacteriales bacterium]
MKRNSKWLMILMSLFLIFATFTACGDAGDNETQGDNVADIPTEVQSIIDKTTEIAANYALQLDGEWADEYAACLASGQGRDYAGYDNLKATLDQFRVESGAYYIYILTDMDPNDDYYEITVDGSEEPDDWMVQYETEGQFLLAQNGQPSAALSAWDNDVDDPVWSAFAPVYNSEGVVVGILGVDYPAPEILALPEWNRDTDEWNGMAHPLTPIPAED